MFSLETPTNQIEPTVIASVRRRAFVRRYAVWLLKTRTLPDVKLLA